jgi:hypothetical protein
MSAIVLLDTSIYLNVLNVPRFNQERNAVLGEFPAAIEAGNYFLLPLATVWETGNHIADLPDGQTRRRYAERLIADVTKALWGERRPIVRPTFRNGTSFCAGWRHFRTQ